MWNNDELRNIFIYTWLYFIFNTVSDINFSVLLGRFVKSILVVDDQMIVERIKISWLHSFGRFRGAEYSLVYCLVKIYLQTLLDLIVSAGVLYASMKIKQKLYDIYRVTKLLMSIIFLFLISNFLCWLAELKNVVNVNDNLGVLVILSSVCLSFVRIIKYSIIDYYREGYYENVDESIRKTGRVSVDEYAKRLGKDGMNMFQVLISMLPFMQRVPTNQQSSTVIIVMIPVLYYYTLRSSEKVVKFYLRGRHQEQNSLALRRKYNVA